MPAQDASEEPPYYEDLLGSLYDLYDERPEYGAQAEDVAELLVSERGVMMWSNDVSSGFVSLRSFVGSWCPGHSWPPATCLVHLKGFK